MKRSKKMMFATLLATTAIAGMLMSRAALAAPATTACPTQAALNSILSGIPECKTGTCPSAQQLQDILNKCGSLPVIKSGSACPSVSALQNLLTQYGLKMPATVSGTCPKATTAPAPKATPAPAQTPAPAPTATPKPTATPAPTPAPVSGSMTADESTMINLVNQDRAANGLPALKFDAGLRAGALAHSQDMMQNNYFSHTSPTQGDFSARVRASGVKYSSAGENIALYGSVQSAEVGFMNSPGHRANILNTSFTRVGIGIVYDQSKSEYYITQWFAN